MDRSTVEQKSNQDIPLRLTPFLEGFVSPVCLRSYGRDIYIADQIGIIYRADKLADNSSIFLDIRNKIPKLEENYDERGLLAFTFYPGDSSRLFVYYSEKSDDKNNFYNVLSEFTVNKNIVDYNSEVILLEFLKDYPYHNGADLHFGPDNYLYLSTGDGGPQKDPRNYAQDLSVLYGKILRLDVDTPGKIYVPSDNPFVNVQGAAPQIYAYGLRNPWRMSFDNSGRLFVGDVGYETREEVDIVVKGGNYGWNVWEGSWKTPWNKVNKDNYRFPIYEYRLPGMSAIIGGYFINDEIGYVFGDYNKTIMRIKENSREAVNSSANKVGTWELVQSTKIDKFIKSFGYVDNILYVLTSGAGNSKRDGVVYTLNF